MAGRGILPPILQAPRSTIGGGSWATPGGFGPSIPSMLDGVHPQLFAEEKMAAQRAEIQKLISENQRLAATHVALRQEVAAAQQEVQRLQQLLGRAQAEKDQRFQAFSERTAKMEMELRTLEPLKVELQRAQTEVQKLVLGQQELSAQLHHLTQELLRVRSDAQFAPSLKAEIDGLSQEIQHARTAFDFEKKGNTELLEQRMAMEKNLVSMAREVEKLRAELANVDKKAGGAHGLEGGYGSVASYGELYGMSQIGPGAPAWGGYDMLRAGVRR